MTFPAIALHSHKKIKNNTYPKKKGLDCLFSQNEELELKKLKAIRRVIQQSKTEFDEGKGVLLTEELFETLKKEARTKYAFPRK